MEARRLFIIVIILYIASSLFAANPGWLHKDVKLRVGHGLTITGINYPPEKEPPMAGPGKEKPLTEYKQITRHRPNTPPAAQQEATVLAAVINSPPINGFVPWIAITATDASSGDYDDSAAVPEPSVTGNYLTSDPAHNYAMGIFDTGAGAHVLGYGVSTTIGLQQSQYLTGSTTTIEGVTGSVDTMVTYPVALFIAGIDSIKPDKTLDLTKLKGESNISVLVGEDYSPNPDIATAVGAPLSVFYTTQFRNDRPQSLTLGGTQYSSPLIKMYDADDDSAPHYANTITLQLYPSDATDVEFIDLEDLDMGWIPSVIGGGNFEQSLFFPTGVDLYKGTHMAYDKTQFMLDTGAEVSVFSKAVGARLGVNPASPDFTTDIEGVDGQTVTEPGFYVDEVDVVSLGNYLTLTHIPMVMLDVASPDGSTTPIDGIIGMNCFTTTNMILRGGAFEDAPTLEWETMPLAGDIAPSGGDNTVNYKDLAKLASCWLLTSASPGWDPACDIAPQSGPDGKVNLADFAVLASNWMKTQ